jgi:hypothetical protein
MAGCPSILGQIGTILAAAQVARPPTHAAAVADSLRIILQGPLPLGGPMPEREPYAFLGVSRCALRYAVRRSPITRQATATVSAHSWPYAVSIVLKQPTCGQRDLDEPAEVVRQFRERRCPADILAKVQADQVLLVDMHCQSAPASRRCTEGTSIAQGCRRA